MSDQVENVETPAPVTPPSETPDVGVSIEIVLDGQPQAAIKPTDPMTPIHEAMLAYAATNQRLQELTLKRSAEIDAVMTDEQKARIAEIENRYAPLLSTVGESMASGKTTIAQLVKAHGATVKHGGVIATFKRGSVKWDDNGLLHYATQQHPEIMKFRGETDASVAVTIEKK